MIKVIIDANKKSENENGSRFTFYVSGGNIFRPKL
jgi:hypothetical protein